MVLKTFRVGWKRIGLRGRREGGVTREEKRGGDRS